MALMRTNPISEIRSANARRMPLSPIATIAALVGVSALTAAGFERPLGRLIEGIRRVGGGDLSGDPLEPSGPAEVVAATNAFNDMAANLRLLESQVRALSASELDDPSLAEPLPGGIGAEMAASVEVLARSVAARTELEERLAATARTGDLCARFGGDEFLVVAEEVDGAMGARSLALRLAAVVGQPIEVDGATVGVGASIGMAMAEPDDTPLTLIARADVAAYEAKRSEVDVVLGDEPVGDEAPPVA